MTLHAKVIEKMASRASRLHHFLWHQLRDTWETPEEEGGMSTEQKKIIEDCGWKPERASIKNSTWLLWNDSGVDFLFMHRQMIKVVNEITKENQGDSANFKALEGWSRIPTPSDTSSPVPQAWELYGDLYSERLKNLKTDVYYYALIREWERKFRDQKFLKGIFLGELGARIESTIHNDMHMRWCDRPWDARTTKQELSLGRPDDSIDKIWDNPKYNWLGDVYSSHVNPTFWKLHGWVDDCIKAWYEANKDDFNIEMFQYRNVTWFKGNLVGTDNPWTGGIDFSHMQKQHLHERHHNEEVMEKIANILLGCKQYHFYNDYL